MVGRVQVFQKNNPPIAYIMLQCGCFATIKWMEFKRELGSSFGMMGKERDINLLSSMIGVF